MATMTSRERVRAALAHKQPDRVPFDLGGSILTGIHAQTLFRLRQLLGLPERRITICDPFQMLGRVDEDLAALIGVDVVGLYGRINMFGAVNGDFFDWDLPDGTPVRFPGTTGWEAREEGFFVYPKGDKSVAPSGRMPKSGFFFDNIERAPRVDPDDRDAAADFALDWGPLTDEDARYYEQNSRELYEGTNLSVLGLLGGGGLGDVAMLPGPGLLNPTGVRHMEDWLCAHISNPDYITDIFEVQTQACLKNLEIYHQAVGERIDCVLLSGTDFGTQQKPFLAVEVFQRMYKPYYKRMCDWIHRNTTWKAMFHSCGCVEPLLEDLIEAGMDVLNPVQFSANGMDPMDLKTRYGDRITFWGGGVDTQKTLPFGTPEEVEQQVAERLEILSPGGGFVFAAIHNIVANTSLQNVQAMLRALQHR